MLALQELKGLVVLDEVQRRPELFPVLRVLADRKPTRTRFLVLGSAAPDSGGCLSRRIKCDQAAGLRLSILAVSNEEIAQVRWV